MEFFTGIKKIEPTTGTTVTSPNFLKFFRLKSS